jgi:hypothetical protein|tara:strand:- start:215 stop:334 length:120 start_codon:yes stop_codon:yes gene_type:complete
MFLLVVFLCCIPNLKLKTKQVNGKEEGEGIQGLHLAQID